MYPVVHLEDEFSATSSASSSSKTLWGRWGCTFFGAISKNLKKKKGAMNVSFLKQVFKFFFWFSFDFLSFFQRSLLLHPLQKHFEGVDNRNGVPLDTFFGAISKNKIKKDKRCYDCQLSSGFKLFWDNCELGVLSHLLEKFSTFFANDRRGPLFLCFQLSVEGWVFMSADSEYWNRTITLIPFVEAIKHFCNFIP